MVYEPLQRSTTSIFFETLGMNHRIRATFHGGAFVPALPYELHEGANVDLLIDAPSFASSSQRS